MHVCRCAHVCSGCDAGCRQYEPIVGICKQDKETGCGKAEKVGVHKCVKWQRQGGKGVGVRQLAMVAWAGAMGRNHRKEPCGGLRRGAGLGPLQQAVGGAEGE